jgi:Kef-type K+ transport system membrane component KefB
MIGDTNTNSPRRPLWWPALIYGGMLVAAVLIFFWIRWIGEDLQAPTLATGFPGQTSSARPHVEVLPHVLLTLATVIVCGYGLGQICRWFGQPPVIGEVLAGILLGPSFLGAWSPDAMHALIPDASVDPGGKVTAAIAAIAQVGVILYMFLVGLELNAAKLKHQAQAAVAISHASIVAPFVLGAALALWLYPLVSNAEVPFTSFALFMGVAMSVTAFPVLARILTDRQLQHTSLGTLALSCAAADDLTAWCLLALVVGVAQSDLGQALWVGVAAAGYLLAMTWLVRPLAVRWCEHWDEQPGPLPTAAITGAFLAILASAWITETIGIHALFGAFLLGTILPHDSRLSAELTARLRDPVTILLLPAFFAYTGMRTEIGLLDHGQAWLVCGAIIAVATVGKVGGTMVAARCTGASWSTAGALGILMNTRGLMGLIVLNVGLDLGVISPLLFTMMVLMALVTTLMTGPVLARLAAQPV